MGGGQGMSPELKDQVYDAVRAELVESGIDRFSVDGVAGRCGVEPGVILAHWRDRRVLLMEALLARTVSAEWSPDTGSLYTDLEAVSARALENSRTAPARALFRRVLPGGTDADLAEICSDLWAARFRDAATMLQRAADRGQLRDGVLPEDAIRMFTAAFYYDVIFTDSQVRPEYGEQVVDIFLHGVVGAAGRDRPWPEVDNLLRRTGSATDHAVEVARRGALLARITADALPDPVVLLEAVRDDEGRVVDFICRDANRAACEQAGTTRHQMLGNSVVEMMPNFGSNGMLERYGRCLNGGEPLVLNDYLYQHFDFDVSQRFDLRATSAGADLLTVTWRDVTERFEAAQLDKRYRSLMDFSAVPAALATPGGALASVNQALATMLGYDIDTLLTMTWQDLTAPETLEEELEAVADIIAGRRASYRAVKQFLHADGHRIWADLSLGCTRLPTGEVEHFIAQVIDITAFRDPTQ